jgi:uncharacterized membrane protein
MKRNIITLIFIMVWLSALRQYFRTGCLTFNGGGYVCGYQAQLFFAVFLLLSLQLIFMYYIKARRRGKKGSAKEEKIGNSDRDE